MRQGNPNIQCRRHQGSPNQLPLPPFQKASAQWGRSANGRFCKQNQKPSVFDDFKTCSVFTYLQREAGYAVFESVGDSSALPKVEAASAEDGGVAGTLPPYFVLSVNRYF